MKKVIFVCSNGYAMPYSRVRGYHFARVLNDLGMDTQVLSFQDHLSAQRDPIAMLELSDRQKLWLSVKAFSRLAKEKDAIFYIQKACYHAAAPFILSRMGKNKFILDYDDWDIDRHQFFRSNYLNRLFFSANDPGQITANLARRAECCIVSSKYLFDYLSGFHKSVFYIPTGVDTQHFKPPLDPVSSGKTVFVWTGQVWGEVMYQNLRFILDCFFATSKACPSVCLKIIGGGAMMPKVKQDIKQDFKDLDIQVIDWVEPKEMPACLASADVGLLPLLPDEYNDLWMRAKSPTKMFEYMAMGLATVSNKMGEVCHIVEDGKEGYLAENKEEFIEKMKILAVDKKIRCAMGLAARNKAQQYYSLNVLGKKLFDIILRLQK